MQGSTDCYLLSPSFALSFWVSHSMSGLLRILLVISEVICFRQAPIDAVRFHLIFASDADNASRNNLFS